MLVVVNEIPNRSKSIIDLKALNAWTYIIIIMQPIENCRVDMICQKHKTSASDCHFNYNEARKTEKKRNMKKAT